MSHALDMTKGKAAIAYRGETPWHGLGETILPVDDLHTIRLKAGIDYDVAKTPVHFNREIVDVDGSKTPLLTKMPERCVLYRSDTGTPLSVVSDRYQVVQPSQIIEFYRDLTDRHGFEIETVGALNGGRKVWALANTKNAVQLRDNDRVQAYLLLATSYDGSMSTQARLTAIRVVCNNTLTAADAQGRADVVIPHSTQFDADRVKLDLKIGDVWEQFGETAERMADRKVEREEVSAYLMSVYFGIETDEQRREFAEKHSKDDDKTIKKFTDRLTFALFESPGANLAAARGTLWGALNAVTFDVDHTLPSRSNDTRLNKAWFGTGEALKNRAWAKAKQLLAA